MDLLRVLQQALRALIVARGGRSRIAEIGAHRIHYYEVRGAPGRTPLVLVHGLGGSANGFGKILSPLARRFGSVFALDLPGHGFSPVPLAGPAPLRGHLEVLAAFCQKIPERPVFAVGNSLGGALCVTLAHEFPQQVAALGLIAPAGAPMQPAQVAELSRAMSARTLAEADALTRRLFHRPPILARMLSFEWRKLYNTAAVRGILSEANSSLFLKPEILSGLKIPVLLLWGESEKLLPFEGVDYFRSHLPKEARVEVVHRFGHIPQIEHSRELVRRLIAFADEFNL